MKFKNLEIGCVELKIGTENHIGRSNWNKCEKLLIRGITFNDNNNTLQDEKNIKFEYKPTLISPIELNIHVYSKN